MAVAVAPVVCSGRTTTIRTVGYVCGAHRTFGVMPATAGVTFHGREKSGRGVEVSGAGQFSRQLGEPFGTTALCCDGIAEQPSRAVEV